MSDIHFPSALVLFDLILISNIKEGKQLQLKLLSSKKKRFIKALISGMILTLLDCFSLYNLDSINWKYKLKN